MYLVAKLLCQLGDGSLGGVADRGLGTRFLFPDLFKTFKYTFYRHRKAILGVLD